MSGSDEERSEDAGEERRWDAREAPRRTGRKLCPAAEEGFLLGELSYLLGIMAQSGGMARGRRGIR
jgi:hypothetical protein